MNKELLKKYPTLYCSVKAHLRGKLHMRKLRFNTLLDLEYEIRRAGFGKVFSAYNFLETKTLDKVRQICKWTMDDQEKLVRKILEVIRESDDCAAETSDNNGGKGLGRTESRRTDLQSIAI